jgi:tetratricopeptide (TPR) repeat protein
MAPDDPERVDLLVHLGRASVDAGDLERARSALDEGLEVSSQSGDVGLEIRARLVRLALLWQTEPEGVTEQLKREADMAIPILEELDDDEGLAHAWYALCRVGLMWCHASDMETASERAVFHAERAGDRAMLSEVLMARMYAPILGMARPGFGIQRCEEIRARFADDRLLQALGEIAHGDCLAQLGLFDEGRTEYRRAEETLLDLGQKMWLGGLSQNRSGLESLAGDPEAAERTLREGMEQLESIGDFGFRSTMAVSLAHSLYEQGRFEEAADMVGVSEDLGASDDLVNHIMGRGIRAMLLGRGGRIEAAVARAEDAVGMTDGIDFWDTLSVAFENLGEVYRLAGRRDDAISALRQSLDVCERKGAVAALEQIRGKLAHVGSTS